MKLQKLTPPQMLATSFILLIFLGTFLLKTSWASNNGTSWLDAFFTATSAVCVTGLVVVDTGTHWSIPGQIIILILIQIGGLGVMSFATFFALLLGKKIQLKQRLVMQQAINKPSTEGIVKIFRYLLIFSFSAEAIGALLLAFNWAPAMGYPRALWYGIFHSVSAFNNAGFDIFGNFESLTGHASDITTNLIISGLFILSGLGFVVIHEILNYTQKGKISLHTKVVLITTLALIITGTTIIFFLEYNHALKDLSLTSKITAAFFQAVTPRTAGFNTLDMNSFYLPTQVLIMLFMFIGGSPGSTAGGIKTTTFAVLWIAIYSILKGKQDIEIQGRRIDPPDILRALTIVLLALSLVFLLTFFLAITQEAEFIKILFEAVSAIGTVGLSLGLTTDLTPAGRLLVILTMFLGRLGPLTIGYALALKKRHPEKRYPEGKIMLG